MTSGSFRRLATGGFLVGVAAAAVLSTTLETAWWFGLPSFVAVAGGASAFALHAWAVAKAKPRHEAAAFALALLAFSPLADGTPDGLAWVLAAASAGGFLLALEAGFASRRLARLEEAEGAEAHIERVAGPLRRGILVTGLGIVVVAFLSQAIGRTLLGLAGASLGPSLEATGLYGTAVGLGALAAVVGVVAYARHLRQAA